MLPVILRKSRVVPMILVAGVTAALAGCAAAPAEDDGTLSVVASTNVYGSLAELIGGDAVRVTSLIDSASQDPHSFEASARDRLELAGADLVIVNGGGYDPFMDSLLDATADDELTVIDAFELSGLAEGENEHVWYDFAVMSGVAATIAEDLSALDPANESHFLENLATVEDGFEELGASADALAAEVGGRDAAITEPVPVYLLESVGLVNVTPDAFSEAIEEGADVAPRDLEAMLELIDSRALLLLAYNDQTTNAQTEQVRTAAESAGVAVVSFTETLPDGLDYLEWMSSNLDSIAAAVG